MWTIFLDFIEYWLHCCFWFMFWVFLDGSTWRLISLTRDRTQPPPLGDKFSTTGLGRSQKPFFFLILKILSGEAGREGKRVRGHTEEKTCLIFQNEERKSGIVNRMQSARNFRWAAKRAEGIASQQNRQTQRRKGYNQGYRPSRTVFGGVGVSLCFKLPLLECSCFTMFH